MFRRILLFGLIAAAILGFFWLIRRSGSSSSEGQDLQGCLGVAEDRIEPGQVGRVRVMDQQGNPVILSALLDESTSSSIDKGTKLVVISNGQNERPPVVGLVDLPGAQD